MFEIVAWGVHEGIKMALVWRGGVYMALMVWTLNGVNEREE